MGCQKEEKTPNNSNGSETGSGTDNTNTGNSEELEADFELSMGANPIPGCAMYLDTVTIKATNKSKGNPVDFEWGYQVHYSRTMSSSLVPVTTITDENWSRVVDLILNQHHDSTFVKISLTVTDAEGNTSEKSQIIAYDMMKPFGHITYDGKTYYIEESTFRVYHRNVEEDGDCIIKIIDDIEEDNITFHFDLYENTFDAIKEITVREDPELLGDSYWYRGYENTIQGFVFGVQERSDVLKQIEFSGTVEDQYNGVIKNISAEINWLVASKTLLPEPNLPDCKLD